MYSINMGGFYNDQGGLNVLPPLVLARPTTTAQEFLKVLHCIAAGDKLPPLPTAQPGS